jgi:hypothetical protein
VIWLRAGVLGTDVIRLCPGVLGAGTSMIVLRTDVFNAGTGSG